MIKKSISLFILFLPGWISSFSQTFLLPNVALKSHETLDIMKVEITEEKTLIFLKVENRITGGDFCADRNIYIVYPDGVRSLLVASHGIPVCPDTYKFKSAGEQLDFVLTFPPLRKGFESVNLIEDCNQNCFSFYGIILDNNLNKDIDDAFALAENSEPAKALVRFTEIADRKVTGNPGAAGLLYLNVVQLYRTTGNAVRAAEWYKKLESSGLPETELYIKHLNSIGIRY
jgi:hypothetical protein